MKTLVVPLDRSTRSQQALPIARAIAGRGHCDVSVMTATDGPPADEDGDYLRAMVASDDGSRTTTGSVPADPSPAAAIVRFAEWAADPMICMSTHGRGGVGTAVIGSTADEVLRTSSHPVLLVGPHCKTADCFATSRLLVPLDGSDVSEQVVPLAIDLAHQLDLAPWLVQVDVPFDEQMAREMESVFDRVSARFVEAGFEVHTKTMFASDPGRSIAAYARTIDASLIAMTSHVSTGLRRLMLGSVTTVTVHAAPCPVVVMHPDTSI